MTRAKKPIRQGAVTRKTRETHITARLTLDGNGQTSIQCPIGFLTHMLETLARHAMFDLELEAHGDLHVDQHHLVEDCGLVLGQALNQALGNRSGIVRAGHAFIPMDEALAMAAVDIGGRPWLQYRCRLRRRFCGELDTDLLPDFFQAFANACKANIVVRVLQGRNDHHKIEAMFKAFARALRQACAIDPRGAHTIPSTKGVIET